MDFYTDEKHKLCLVRISISQPGMTKSWRKWAASNKSFVKTCHAQTDRLVKSDNSTESPILKERGKQENIILFSSIELELAHSCSTC